MDVNEWLDEAVGGLVPRKTRAAVRAELQAHYLDRLDALKAKGLSPEAARTAALAALGDPEETGRLLRRVHQPWLTHLLRLTRLLLIAVLIPMLVYSSGLWGALKDRRDRADFRDRYVAGTRFMPADNVSEEQPYWLLIASRQGQCSETAKLAGHRISVLAAWTLWVRSQESIYDIQECYVVLRIETPPWVTPDPDVLERNLRVSADGGAPERSYLLLQERGEDFTPNSFTCWELYRDLGSCDYILSLDKPEDPDRLDLIYEAGGEAFTLTVIFDPRVEAEGGTQP